MPKGRRVDNLRPRPLVTPESGAHARITPIDARRAEDFSEPDTALVALAAKDEVELSQTRVAGPKGVRNVEELERRLQALESELETARESLRQKDIELQSLHSLRIPAALPVPESLRAIAAQAAPPLPAPPEFASVAPPSASAPSAPSSAAHAPSSAPRGWQPASPSPGYPMLQNVAVALRASTLPPTDDATPPSQRRAPRRSCEIELEFTEETQFFTGLTQDISQGGVFVATYNLFPIGSRLELAFELPDGTKVSTWGRVRWLREETPHGRPGMGVEFGELSETTLAAIVRFCEARPPLYMEV